LKIAIGPITAGCQRHFASALFVIIAMFALTPLATCLSSGWVYNCGMQYIIDGHNLIPHVRGLSLQDLEDEQALIDILTPFLRATSSRALVFFDKAAQGHEGKRNFGLVQAVFVPASQSADSAIENHIHKLGASARNQTLVSSDRRVQAAGRARYMTILSSSELAHKIQAQVESHGNQTRIEKQLTPDEIARWEELFSQYGSQPPDGLNP